MSESQDARSPDPYKALELHPHAPRDLVVAAYWALIERAKGRRAASHATGVQIDELNAAYRLLADGAARAAYDEQHARAATRRPEVRVAAKGIRLFGIGAPVRMVSDHDDFYHLLRLDREAGADVVDAAFAVMSGQAVGRDTKAVFLRGLLEEARHTLRNPQLRAQYDASLRAGGRKQTTPRTVEEPSPAPGPLSPVPYPLSPTHNNPQPTSNGTGTHPVPPAAAPPITYDLEPATSSVPPMFARDGQRQDPEPPAAAPLTPAVVQEPEPEPAQAGPPTTYDLRPTTSPRPTTPARRGILNRLRMPSRPSAPAKAGQPTTYNLQPTTSQIIEAEHARLMTLREDRAPYPAAATPAAGTPPAAVILAELVFLEGPRAGERVPLGADAINLGSSYASHVVLTGDEEHIAPEHARIWLHGDHFVFRQLDDGDTMICGQPLTLPMIVLDDGDEIRISLHRMRLEHRA